MAAVRYECVAAGREHKVETLTLSLGREIGNDLAEEEIRLREVEAAVGATVTGEAGRVVEIVVKGIFQFEPHLLLHSCLHPSKHPSIRAFVHSSTHPSIQPSMHSFDNASFARKRVKKNGPLVGQTAGSPPSKPPNSLTSA